MPKSWNDWRFAKQSRSKNGWACIAKKEKPPFTNEPIGRPRKEDAEIRELERLRMENALLKKFHCEMRELQLAQRNNG